MYLSLSDWTSRKAQSPSKCASVAFRASPTVIALGIVSMLTDISSESVAAILPLYITGALGLSMVAYGFFEGMNQSVSALVRIAAGYTADRSNRPKPIATAGYSLSMLARVGLLFVNGVAGIMAVVGIDRIGKGIRTAPRDAMIQQASQPEHLARSFGLHRLLDTVGATVGPLLAFIVLVFIPDGYRAVFVMSLAAAILGVAVLGLVVPNKKLHSDITGTLASAPQAEDTATANSAAQDRSEESMRQEVVQGQVVTPTQKPTVRMFTRGRFGRLLVAAALLGLLTVGDGFIYLALLEHGQLDTKWFPLLFVGSNFVFLILAVPLGKMADKTSRAGIFAIGHLALALAYFCASRGGSVVMILLCLALLGTFYAATDGVLAALAGQLSPSGSTATGIGAAQTVVAVSRLVASTGFGVLWVLCGGTTVMSSAAVLLGVLVPMAWLLLMDKRTAVDGAAT